MDENRADAGYDRPCLTGRRTDSNQIEMQRAAHSPWWTFDGYCGII